MDTELHTEPGEGSAGGPRPAVPGTARTMPMRAQKTISWMTRGLVSAWYWRQTEGMVGAREVGAVLMGRCVER